MMMRKFNPDPSPLYSGEKGWGEASQSDARALMRVSIFTGYAAPQESRRRAAPLVILLLPSPLRTKTVAKTVAATNGT